MLTDLDETLEEVGQRCVGELHVSVLARREVPGASGNTWGATFPRGSQGPFPRLCGLHHTHAHGGLRAAKHTHDEYLLST